LEQERNPRVAAQLMADVELGRSILSQEEGEWLRLSEDASARAGAVKGAHERLAGIELEQNEARAALRDRMSALEGELTDARSEREESASQLDRTLRIRYDRLRGSRTTEILVPAGNPSGNATCTACFTAIPRSRIGRLQAEGLLLDGCEMCGAIVYLAEVTV
jgi:predicted  nucleic acid-binding Zn-ribbon protein